MISECYQSCSNFMLTGCRFSAMVDSHYDCCPNYQQGAKTELNAALVVLQSLEQEVEQHLELAPTGRSLRLAHIKSCVSDVRTLIKSYKEVNK